MLNNPPHIHNDVIKQRYLRRPASHVRPAGRRLQQTRDHTPKVITQNTQSSSQPARVAQRQHGENRRQRQHGAIAMDNESSDANLHRCVTHRDNTGTRGDASRRGGKEVRRVAHAGACTETRNTPHGPPKPKPARTQYTAPLP